MDLVFPKRGCPTNIVTCLIRCFTQAFLQKCRELVEQYLPTMIFFQVFVDS